MDERTTSGHLYKEWPSEWLEELSRCPICHDSSRIQMHDGLQDHIFFCAPGKWSMWRCDECRSGYLDPRPTIDHIGIAYSSYYTHESKQQKNDGNRSGKIRRSFRLRERLRSAYLNSKYGHDLKPDFSLLNHLALLSPKHLIRQWDYFIRNLPSPSDCNRLLDIGCGSGHFLRIARALGFDSLGIEVDPVVIRNAQASGEKVIHGRLPDTGLESESFDHITLHHVLEHLHDPDAGLRECFRLLKKGGRLWVQVPNIDSIGHETYGPFWRGLEPPRHLILPSFEGLKALLSEVGFIRTRFVTSADAVNSYFAKSDLIRDVSGSKQKQGVSLAMRRRALQDERRYPERHEHLTFVAYRP